MAADGAFTGKSSPKKTGLDDGFSETVAETNSECQILTYASHTRECFPNLSMESTLRHEQQHRATCKKRGNAGPMSAEELGADEVLAYGAENDLLTGWADRNCSD